jgi:hypothetical protein
LGGGQYSGGKGEIGQNASSRIEKIGLAVSSDGVNWSRMNSGNPVLDIGPPGSIDDIQVSNPTVVVGLDGVFRMYYSAYHHNLHSIELAYSINGEEFFKASGADQIQGLDPDQTGALGPSVYFDGTSYLMFYSLSINNEWIMIKALSDDGINWRKDPMNLNVGILGPAIKGRFDEGGLGRNHSVHPSLPILFEGNVLLFYTGESSEKQAIGVAIQKNGSVK